MQLQYHGLRFDWRKLKSTSIEMGLIPLDVFDSNYGTVKAYHKDVWLEIPLDVFDSNYGTVKSYHKDVWLETYALNIDVDCNSKGINHE